MNKTKNTNDGNGNDVTNHSIFGIKYERENIAIIAPHKYNNKDTVTVSSFAFFKRLTNVLSGIIDDDFVWNGVIMAGGLVSGLLESSYDPDQYCQSDIDLFVHKTSSLDVKETMQYVYQYLWNKFKGQIYAFIYKWSSVVTIVIPGKRNVQIIGINNETLPLDIIKLFDMTHCQVAFNGEKVIFTSEYLRAVSTRVTCITKSSIQAYRILKAYMRGYSIENSKCYIKNTFHSSMVEPGKSGHHQVQKDGNVPPSNTEKYRYLEEIDIAELIDNDIVKKNILKNYIPTNDTSIDDAIENINKSYTSNTDQLIWLNDPSTSHPIDIKNKVQFIREPKFNFFC